MNYNHKKTTFVLVPSILRTVDYLQSMLLHFKPLSISPKPSLSSLSTQPRRTKPIGPLLSSLCRECHLKLDFRVEEISIGFLASWSHPTPLIEAVWQSIACSFQPSPTRSSVETILSFSHDLQFKIGSFGIKNATISRETLRQILRNSASNLSIPPCSGNIISLENLEISSILSNWERLSVECSSKTCNVALSYPVVDMAVLLAEEYLQEIADYVQHRKDLLPKSASFYSMDLSSGSGVTPQTPIRPMSEADEDAIFLENLLNGSILPDGLNEIADLTQMEISGSPFTHQDSTSSSLNGSVRGLSSHPSPQKSPPPDAISASSDEEIYLSDNENGADEALHSQDYRFCPLFLSNLSVGLNNIEIQVIGKDLSHSTSYTMKCISLTVSSQDVESMEKVLTQSTPPTVPVDGLYTGLSDTNFANLPMYISPHSAPGSSESLSGNSLSTASSTVKREGSEAQRTVPVLQPINESNASLLSSPGIDLSMIPDVSSEISPPAIPILPVTMRKNARRHQPLFSMNSYTMHTSSTPFLRNGGLKYTIKIDISNLNIIGDEGSHDATDYSQLDNGRINSSNSRLPVAIPRIHVSLPTLLFLSFSSSQLPPRNDLAFMMNQSHYQASSLCGFNGFSRGDQSFVLLATNNQDINEFHLHIERPRLKLSFGSIFVIYHSFMELAESVKTSSIRSILASFKKQTPTSPKVKRPSLLLDFRFCMSLADLAVRFDFTPKVGLYVEIEKITAVTPDSVFSPLLLLSNLQISQLQDGANVCLMLTLVKITLYSPSVYDKLDIASIRKGSLDGYSGGTISTQLCCCGKCVACKRYLTCPTCAKHDFSKECNGWDNRCNQHTSHVPEGVKPYLVIVESADCLQDRQFSWGDLIYAAQLQWKAFKTIRRGQRPPPPFPHPDAERAAKVAEHAALDSSIVQKGFWLQVVADSVVIRLQDVIAAYSAESVEYSRLFVTGVNGVLLYNPLLHSRAHFLNFIKTMDEAKTPMEQGFDDVLGFHIHDLNVEKVLVDFGELPPLVAGEALSACGTCVFADMNRVERYVRREVVQLYCSTTFDPIPVEVLRCSVSTKFYQNLVVEGSQLEVFWGNPLYWVRSSFANGMGDLTPRGVSKSPKMCWYDKIRFSVHGPLFLRVHDQLRVNWITDKEVDGKYEALLIDFMNADMVFRQLGGCNIAFDTFSIGTSTFDSQKHLIETLLIEIEGGAFDVSILWGNEDTRNHYVELDPAVSDDVDKYGRYRSNTIEWKMKLLPVRAEQYSVSIYGRLEMANFLWDFWNMIFEVNPQFPVDKTPGLARSSTAFDVDFNLNDSMFWL